MASATSAAQQTQTSKFHLSLNVADLARSVEFFSLLLGCEPAKRREDYAKFEPEAPALVLSLEPIAPQGSGSLNHLGFRMPSVESLVEMQRRLEASGLSTQREEGIECCYAKQTKFWLHDPDGNLWEVYTLDGDLEHRGMAPQLASLPQTATRQPTAAKAIWSHRLGQPIPHKLFVQPETVDEANLQGSFNVACSPEERRCLLGQIFQALKPGGKLTLHMLTGDRCSDSLPVNLPGPAAAVEAVPVVSELVEDLEASGFTALQFEKFGDAACFVLQGVQMRETLLAAYKPQAPETATETVLYKGPFAELRLDDGTVLKRGQFTSVPASVSQQLKATAADQFTFAGEVQGSCGM